METYSKDGDKLKVAKQIEDATFLSYEEIESNIAYHQAQIVRWQALKVEADTLGLKPVEESNEDVTP